MEAVGSCRWNRGFDVEQGGGGAACAGREIKGGSRGGGQDGDVGSGGRTGKSRVAGIGGVGRSWPVGNRRERESSGKSEIQDRKCRKGEEELAAS